jgi:TonB family protein
MASAALHLSASALVAVFAVAQTPENWGTEKTDAAPEIFNAPRMVFLQMPGPGGGGGGGGNRQLSPPSRMENIGPDAIALPVARPVRAAHNPAEEAVTQSVAVDAVPLTSGTAYRIGTPYGAPSVATSQGPGTGGGAGDGFGTGIGAGTGPGFGPGSGGGFGGGVYRPGNGVTAPTLLSQVRPNYTSDAMQRKIQGTVVLEMIVGTDGIPYDVHIVRSLDAHGLDEEAIRAAKQWRFNPGRLGDVPVEVLVKLVIDFHIR